MSHLHLPQAAPRLPVRFRPTDVAAALRENRITLYYQPVVQASDTGRIAFHEALLRLRQRDGRIASAGSFIHLVEEGPIGPWLDRRALRLGLDTLEAQPDMRLSVNVSPGSLMDRAWQSRLKRRLKANPTLAERLILEITERAVLGFSEIGPCLKQVQKLGVSLAVDDFGAGATSFRHLREFRFDILKIDGLFSRDIEKNKDNQVLFKALTNVARHFEMMTIAESVESHASSAYLTSIGVDGLQGYAFGRPNPFPCGKKPENSSHMPFCKSSY